MRQRVSALMAVTVLLGTVGYVASLHSAVAAPTGPGASAQSVPAVESLYAQDLVARVNAERAARSTSAVPVPQLQVNAQLQADAQAWSAHIAAVGTVVDPTLPPCNPQANEVCVLAANSGNTGYGFWPGDGSDGMNGDFMQSAAHRQNQLGAAYNLVGVGVTCSADQAWTVELFGYTYGDLPSAYARENSQNVFQGDPVPSSPMVAGAPTGDPVYCPGQTYGPNGAVTSTGGQYPYPYGVPSVPGEPNSGAAPVVSMASTPNGGGYWVVRSDGSITTLGDAVNYGSMAGKPLVAPVSHIVSTPDGRGYWMVAGDGGIFSFGDAGFYGSMGGQPLNAPVVDLAPTADGKGYWLVGTDGGIFAFGNARFYGSMGGQHLNQPVVGVAADDATGGYWMVASDGGVFSFNAPFDGSAGNLVLNEPINGMASTPNGHGYWMVGWDGAIFAYGNARFHGSTGGQSLNAPMVGMAVDRATGGYWLVGSDGGIFAFDAPFYGHG
ncbi:MAG: CAP domain-containing protein [Acidimicrobiales bacterium]|jgi:hypothetical protein